ncbi:hypothetical protein HRbin30_02174 [bacterium HR30]|nr:hypothetical protein HRbin30_02174 [bacterium HR30]
MIRSLIALYLVFALTLPPLLSASGQGVCSSGERDSQPCSEQVDCPGGACVFVQGICDGGTDDGADCECPLSTCGLAFACPNDPVLGSCISGLRAGECCDPAFNCSDGSPCAPTQKVCLDGPLKGFPCLRDAHCLGSLCWALGRRCDDGYACVDDDDCLDGTCQGTGNFPTPTPTSAVTPSPTPVRCVGDCDGDGSVTIDNILTMVNIALGQTPLSSCFAGDENGDGTITVDELVAAVTAALLSCR